ncbi:MULTISPECIES: ATP-binding protein [Metabacillus]|uniref:histidine kinase n=2 Tax=Metabacillus TaxID=2675233 RepID=A0A179SPF7_9BACI|nr:MULTISPECIES: ATP-binding protein [Metabacillus]OAS83188.1 hybrid sensor histidine kinase/response regulator [Metabacillus litoralis]QNF29701.1 response regulator [Metabacillus sp. KUDC1714]
MKSYIEKWNTNANKVNILLVDDRPENLLALESVLSSPEYNLISVNSGEAALKHVLIDNIAVILLDVQMPGIDGFETARMIKSREKSKQIPIIFITAISQALEHVTEGYHSGAIDYIFKPFHPETLRMKIDAFIKIHRYQEQIMFQNEVLRVTGETLADTLVTFDETGKVITTNPAIDNMFGYMVEEIINEHINLIVPDLTKYFGDLIHIGTIIETTALRKNSSVFPADIQIGEASIGGQLVYVCSIRDVTERKLIEEERFRKIFEATPCLVSLRSLKDWHFINVNKSWLTYSGFNHYEEILNQSADPLTYISYEDIGETVVEMADLTHPVYNSRIKYLNKTGELREGLLSTELMELHGENCLLSVITDITERVLVEKEMARLDRLNIVGEMASGIVHEVRNPMTTIRGFLQMSKDFPSSEFIDIMIEELDRAHNIITEFLSVSKNNNTKREWKNLNGVIETLFPLIQAKAMYTDHHVDLDLAVCPSIQIHEREIRQLILNLSLNGLEAMSSSGTLTIKTYHQDDQVVLAIQDQGCGIKDEVIDKIGTPFFSTKKNGTGLGLSICHKVVSEHNGKIKIDSSDKGTTFLVYFPCEDNQLLGEDSHHMLNL